MAESNNSDKVLEHGLVHVLRTAARSGETVIMMSEESCAKASALASARNISVDVSYIPPKPKMPKP